MIVRGHRWITEENDTMPLFDAMGLAPNQKYIHIRKEPTDKQHHYSMINLDAMREAMRKYSGRNANAFILWCYFANNRPGYGFALSSAAVENATGLKRDAYNHAMALLMKDGHIKPTGIKDGRSYDFIERPPTVDPLRVVKIASPHR